MTLRLVHFAATTMLIGLLAVPARANAPAGRYTASGGVVHDNKTGLNWQQVASSTTYMFANAMQYCLNNTPQLPGTGWRLPAIKELQTLLDDKVSSPNPAIDTSANGFPSTPAHYFWSSTRLVGSASLVWVVTFDFANTTPTDMMMTTYVRCVR